MGRKIILRALDTLKSAAAADVFLRVNVASLNMGVQFFFFFVFQRQMGDCFLFKKMLISHCDCIVAHIVKMGVSVTC